MRSWNFLLVLCLTFTLIATQECITPNGYRSVCKLFNDCAPLVSYMYRRPLHTMLTHEKQYINLLLCYTDDDDEQHVCCASDDKFYEADQRGNFITTLPPTTEIEIPKRLNYSRYNLPDPLNFECGSDVLKVRITGGNETELGEYPWLALFEYEHMSTRVRSFSCGGSLINSRYVLTAAHCLTGQVEIQKGRLVNIRLGEHNTKTERDCETMGNEIYCADPAIDVGVELAIAHENFKVKRNGIDNDIGLVRLARAIENTAFIQPICFPSSDLVSPDGHKLSVAGWGRTSSEARSDIKLHVKVPIINFAQCQREIRQLEISNQTQMCAGELGKDSCGGDSGGPLMTYKDGMWFIEGIVSFGTSVRCGDGRPAIYTRVNAYQDWIFRVITSQG